MTDQKRLHLQNKLVDMIVLWNDIDNRPIALSNTSYLKKKN